MEKNQHEKYNFSQNWISKVIESDFPIKIENPLLSSIIKFGLIPDIILAVLFIFRGHLISEMAFIGLFFATIFTNIAPYLIWEYDECILPSSFNRISKLVSKPEKMKVLSKKYDIFFSKKYWIPTLIWIILLLSAFFYFSDVVVKIGIFEMWDVFFWIILLDLIWAGLIHGAGLTLILTTLLSIREISELGLEIDPFHPDQLGGLSPVGLYSIKTTMFFSSGSLFLPLGFEIAAVSALPNFLYIIIGIYLILLVLNFFYPIFKIHGKAEESRSHKIKELRNEYKEMKKNLSTHCDKFSESDTRRLILELELNRKMEEYREYRKTKLYPLEIETIIQLLGSILLPVLFVIFELYASKLI